MCACITRTECQSWKPACSMANGQICIGQTIVICMIEAVLATKMNCGWHTMDASESVSAPVAAAAAAAADALDVHLLACHCFLPNGDTLRQIRLDRYRLFWLVQAGRVQA
mmetsp:Transcript_80980/g.160482  ORF Transcript_80980/g.160482 Transcript_80980/m.160482 type:complete len:110 (-) Transcript_80980:65-394(-)